MHHSNRQFHLDCCVLSTHDFTLMTPRNLALSGKKNSLRMVSLQWFTSRYAPGVYLLSATISGVGFVVVSIIQQSISGSLTFVRSVSLRKTITNTLSAICYNIWGRFRSGFRHTTEYIGFAHLSSLCFTPKNHHKFSICYLLKKFSDTRQSMSS